jgi:hypothetical protein
MIIEKIAIALLQAIEVKNRVHFILQPDYRFGLRQTSCIGHNDADFTRRLWIAASCTGLACHGCLSSGLSMSVTTMSGCPGT